MGWLLNLALYTMSVHCYTTGMDTHICKTCGTEFQHKAYGKNMFCSYACRGKASIVDHVSAFWEKVEKGDGCWLWMASVMSNGYGAAWDGSKVKTAHRRSYELTKGEIPQGMHVLHTCDDRRCVNPDHLFLGTNLDNINDRVAKGRSNRRSRAVGEAHGMSKLTESQVIQIRELASTLSELEVAAQFGVSRNTVNRIVLRRTWKHVV